MILLSPNVVTRNSWNLKLVSAIFCQFLNFSPNDSPSKNIKMFFISSKKLLFFSRYPHFCKFFLSIPTFQIEKDKWKWWWIGLHWFADLVFRITQKPLYITSSNWVKWYSKRDWAQNKKMKLTFLRLFDNPLSKILIFKKISCMQWLFWIIYQN